MLEAGYPENEDQRLQALYEYDILDRDVDAIFDTVIRIAADVCDVDISVIALIDHDRQYFLARNGMKPKETPRAIAFCAHAILEPHKTFEVPDPVNDPRFCDNPLVTGEIGVRFYAAQPLTTADGYALGGLCLLGRQAKELTDLQRKTLQNLGTVIMTLFDSRKKAIGSEISLTRAKEEAETASAAKSEFLNTVNHEIRTPLTSLLGSLGLLLGGIGGELSNDVRLLVEVAHRNGTQLLRLISDLLDFQKMDAGMMDFDMVPQDLAVLINEAVDANQQYAKTLGTSITLLRCPKKVPVSVDSGRFAQVMANLVSNACKYSPPKSPVEISVAQKGKRVWVSVTDHGPGIPKEFRSKLFEKFSQAETPENREHAGTGLGLAIAQNIIERHGGSINLESSTAAGSTFRFDLPIV